MGRYSRREWLRNAGLGSGLAALRDLMLSADAEPTPPSAGGGHGGAAGDSGTALRHDHGPTPATGYGPYFHAGAPFRAKTCPPHEPGTPVVVSGRVWAYDTKRPLPGARIAIWHSDRKGEYSPEGDFRNRARLIASETGYYELEAIHPVGYPVDGGAWWRSPHIHFRVASAGYKTLATELYFRGDPLHEQDRVFREELMMPVDRRRAHGSAFESVVFDIILERA